MGKLAERYQDAARSGVYRVESAEIPLRAASEASARVLEIDAGDTQALSQLRSRIVAGDRRPHVAMVREAGLLAATPGRYATVVEVLAAIARDCRADAVPFFAVMVDPDGALALPRLYKEPLSARNDP
jgi:hypothetical protein